MSAPAPITLRDLRGLRQAPTLSGDDQRSLRRELDAAIASCDWFTIGVMAPSAEQAVLSLRQCEAALGWTPLAETQEPRPAGPVFLKGNQRSGGLLIRTEEGLGTGLLISGHADGRDDAGDTWGPLPLDFFAID